MRKPPFWFIVVSVLALLWNLIGVLAVVADLSLSEADIAALSQAEQAVYAARPLWSLIGTLIAVGAGTLGCLGLLLRKSWALGAFYVSLVGLIGQDLGFLVMAEAMAGLGPLPWIMQGVVLLIAVGLIALAHRGLRRGWLA